MLMRVLTCRIHVLLGVPEIPAPVLQELVAMIRIAQQIPPVIGLIGAPPKGDPSNFNPQTH